MNYTEEYLIQLSSLQHYVFCKRQCALIHIEQLWSENLFTAEGKVMHEHVDNSDYVKRKDVKIDYSVPLRSLRLGLSGKADVVEFYKYNNAWIPYPVEYKRGKPKSHNSDKVQLCAQAMCLEEMLNVDIEKGALFYGKTRRRQDISFDTGLRRETEETAKKVHELLAFGITPAPEYSKKCESCSLLNLCLPKVCAKKSTLKNYYAKVLNESFE